MGGFVPSDILDTSNTSLTELRPASHRLHHPLVRKEGCVCCEWVDWVPPERADWGGRSHPGNGALLRVAVRDHQRMCLSGCVLLFIYFFTSWLLPEEWLAAKRRNICKWTPSDCFWVCESGLAVVKVKAPLWTQACLVLAVQHGKCLRELLQLWAKAAHCEGFFLTQRLFPKRFLTICTITVIIIIKKIYTNLSK